MSDNADFDVIGDEEQCDYCGQWPWPDKRIEALQARIDALEETIRQLYVMAAKCPSDAFADDFDFCTPLEQAEALLEAEK